ncbi:MAG: 3-oxoacyl-ACP synthase III [Phycisphaerae bacterium]
MNYTNVHLESLAYELPPVVVTSAELESRLAPLYQTLRIAPGQLEALTGITERRWWHEDYPLSEGAIAAARKALAKSQIPASEIQTLIYAGVCRENFEPATACAVAAGLGIAPDAYIYDISNACLGVLNGIIDIANRIELGQITAGMVVSCESAREINDLMIRAMLQNPTMAMFTQSLATLTGGSGAVAVVLTHKSRAPENRRRLLGATALAAPQHHRLCRWGLAPASSPDTGLTPFMATDSVSVLKHGVELGTRTWQNFLTQRNWSAAQVDKIICHQVGHGHRNTILKELNIAPDKDFSTFPYLGNIGTVSLPLTAALAEQRGFLKPGDRLGFLGIGSGLNCLMLGWEW